MEGKINQPLIDALEANMRYRDLITLAIVGISQITGNDAVHFLRQAYEMPAGDKNGGEGIGEARAKKMACGANMSVGNLD